MTTEIYKLIDDLKAATILIVSQRKSNAAMIKKLLNKNGFSDIQTTDDPFSVAVYYENEELDLIISDIKLQGMDGFGVMQSLKESYAVNGMDKAIPPVLILTDLDLQEHRRRALMEGANDYINFPFDIREFLARINNLLQIWQAQKIILHQKEILEYKVNQRTQDLQHAQKNLLESRLEVVRRLGRAAEYRDNETGLHIIRMSKIAARPGKTSGLNKEEADMTINASPMHDIGQLGRPDSVLFKPGKLDGDKWKIMQTHAQIGADVLTGSKSPLLEMALYRPGTPRKMDGSGLP